MQRYFYAWQADGLWERSIFSCSSRPANGRAEKRALGRGDRQPVGQNHRERRAARVRRRQEGQGRKRHIITDTNGLLVGAQVHRADIQDRDGAVGVLASIRYLFPWLRHVFADGGYAGEKLATTLAGMGQWTLDIVKRSDEARGFCLLPRRWVVERTFAWLGRNRRLAKDFEATIGSAEAWLYLARSSSWRAVLHGPIPLIDRINTRCTTTDQLGGREGIEHSCLAFAAATDVRHRDALGGFHVD